MATLHTITTPARSQRAHRKQLTETIARQQLELNQLDRFMNTIMPAVEPFTLLNRSHRLRLADVSRRTGVSTETMIHHAINMWLAIEAPVYQAQA